MKKANIINLIKYHTDNNETAFRDESYVIAEEFERLGDIELAHYIYTLLQDGPTMSHMPVPEIDLKYLKQVNVSQFKYEDLLLPPELKEDLIDTITAAQNSSKINKFLFHGSSGTGKTACAKLLAKVLNKRLYVVDFDSLISGRVVETIKNIAALFEEMNNCINIERSLILFDELDALVLVRNSSTELREIVMATTAFLNGLDNLNQELIVVATTNLFKYFDKALINRFDAVIEFDRYTKEDLVKLAEIRLDQYLNKVKHLKRNIRLFRKILALMNPLPYPGYLDNLIKKSISLCNSANHYDYLRKFYFALTKQKPKEVDAVLLNKQGFTAKEIEIIMNKSSALN